jgi:hypothetical protein
MVFGPCGWRGVRFFGVLENSELGYASVIDEVLEGINGWIATISSHIQKIALQDTG